MTKFAAYDNDGIYGIGESESAAIENARASVDAVDNLKTAYISDELAIEIENNGWDAATKTFDVVSGTIVVGEF